MAISHGGSPPRQQHTALRHSPILARPAAAATAFAPSRAEKVIRRRDREGLSEYKRNYVRRETYVMTFDD